MDSPSPLSLMRAPRAIAGVQVASWPEGKAGANPGDHTVA